MAATPSSEDQRQALRTAAERTDLGMERLWMQYFSLGGDCGPVEVEAYLHALMPMPASQRDILAQCVNEHLDDLTSGLHVPYTRAQRPLPPTGGPLSCLVRLLEGTRHIAPERLIEQVTAAGVEIGVGITVHLVDYSQHVLVRVDIDMSDPGARIMRAGARLDISGTMAGQAYQHVRIVRSGAAERGRLWVPLLDGAERLGVLEITDLTGEGDLHDPQLHRECWWLSGMVGHLLTSFSVYGDAFDHLRRLKPRTPAAELIWNLLPPMTAATPRLAVAGQCEPSDRVGGDAFDYALSESTADFAIYDATGHSLSSGLATSTALAASRATRRAGGDLEEQAQAIHEAVTSEFAGSGRYVSAVLARLDLRSGRMRYVIAGHPSPLLMRGGKVVKKLDDGRRPLFGLSGPSRAVGEVTLEPGDILVLYTDGITEARDDNHDFFGEQRLATFLHRAVTSGHPPPETVRRLLAAVLDHQRGRLQDDATVLLARWTPTHDGNRTWDWEMSGAAWD